MPSPLTQYRHDSAKSFRRADVESRRADRRPQQIFQCVPSHVTRRPNIDASPIPPLTSYGGHNWWTRSAATPRPPILAHLRSSRFRHSCGRTRQFPDKQDLIADPNSPSAFLFTRRPRHTAGLPLCFHREGGTSLSFACSTRSTSKCAHSLSIGAERKPRISNLARQAVNAIQLRTPTSGFPGATGATVTFPNPMDSRI